MKENIDVHVDSIAFGGDGVARHDGMAVFIPGGAPGDVLRIEITERNRRYARGSIVQVLQPGASRVVAPCPAYPACGGCQWQHIAYADQFKAKVAIVERALQRFEPKEIHHWPADAPEGYRRRARLHWSNRDGLQFGYRERQSDRLVDITACLQLEPALEACLPHLKNLLAKAGRTSGEAELLCNHLGEIHLALHVKTGDPAALARAMESQVNPVWKGARLQGGSTSMTFGAAFIELDARGLIAHAGAFTQANAHQDAVMRQRVERLVKSLSARHVLELHAGIGNFTFDIAGQGVEVEAIEENPLAVELLRHNCRNLPVTAQVADADHFEWKKNPDCLLLDPPREGAASVMTRIAAKRVPQVIYVSCDPMTLARDVAVLARARYKLRSVDIIDMMPHTYHIEAVCLLARH